jgi:hypothetical protein
MGERRGMSNINKSNVLTTDKDSTWCTLSIDKVRVKAKIKHIGNGKFKILGDESGDKYAGNIVDASDVNHCR